MDGDFKTKIKQQDDEDIYDFKLTIFFLYL